MYFFVVPVACITRSRLLVKGFILVFLERLIILLREMRSKILQRHTKREDWGGGIDTASPCGMDLDGGVFHYLWNYPTKENANKNKDLELYLSLSVFYMFYYKVINTKI